MSNEKVQTPEKDVQIIMKTEDHVYIVQEKDELRNISKKKYNDSSKWRKIYNANRNLIKDPDKIFPGQKLKIPE